MRKRNNAFLVRLTEEEHKRLKQHVRKSGLSREVVVRALINGYSPKSLPPLDYYALLRELRSIGNNLNQLAAKANATGHIDKAIFQYESNRLRRAVLDIKAAVTLPERRGEDGNHGDMGCERPP